MNPTVPAFALALRRELGNALLDGPAYVLETEPEEIRGQFGHRGMTVTYLTREDGAVVRGVAGDNGVQATQK